jgi:ATP-dependent Lhr-like helicase
MTASVAFHLLDERIQRYLWSEQWESLRDVQEQAIPLVVAANRDVVIAAATAEGKTEAAVLPALTHLLQQTTPGLIIYVSPLKALINDQFARLERLCEDLDIPVHPWHGDVTASRKQRFLKRPQGVILITPESLEASLCNRGTSVAATFAAATFVIIDELHAFIGSERGKQLQSILHRIESAIGREVPRIGLSATLGDMRLAADFLRYGQDVSVIESASEQRLLQMIVKGYEDPSPELGSAPQSSQHDDGPSARAIAKHIFMTMRGTNNLVFPNSRREVERYTHLLNGLCEEAKVPNEFWPHHGNLSYEIRADTEFALKQRERPATAVCTSTLELGIDIGAVRSVAQIGSPPSVASLRQRLGRSGRRKGEPAVLRGYQVEQALSDKPSLHSALRLSTVQSAAAITLLLENWFEPPSVGGMHLSTLIQQLLSAIAQFGGLMAAHAFQLLCGKGAPFAAISPKQFAELLRHLASADLLIQDASGLLLHGEVGDKIVNHYSFYAAFAVDEEFRIVTGGKSLGSLPVSQMLTAGQRIVFGGRTWLVESVDEKEKVIAVSPARGGAPPLFTGGVGRVHTRIRQRMRELYEGVAPATFLDATATRFLDEGRSTYRRLNLAKEILLEQGSHTVLISWLGDAGNEALACLLTHRRIKATPVTLGVELPRQDLSGVDLTALLADIAASPLPELDVLLSEASNLQREKWDWALSPTLLRASYASTNLDLREAQQWLVAITAGDGASSEGRTR